MPDKWGNKAHDEIHAENWQRELDTWTETVWTHVDTQYCERAKHWIENKHSTWRDYNVPWQLRECLEQNGKRFEWSKYSDENGVRWDYSGWIEVEMISLDPVIIQIRTNNQMIAWRSCHSTAYPLYHWEGTVTESQEPIAIGPAKRPLCVQRTWETPYDWKATEG